MKAERDGPDQLALFASQHFNVEIGVGLLTDHWPGARHWEKNGDAELTLAVLILDSDVITIGIDGGGLDDMLGLTIVGRSRTGEMRNGKLVYRWFAWSHAWLHRDVLELRKQDAPKFKDLEAAGDLTIVDDLAVAYAELVDQVMEIGDTGKLGEIGVDRWGVKLITDELERRGIAKDQIVAVPQGTALQGVIKSVESKLASGLITHCSQPMMAWCVGNAKVELKGNAVLITKQASGSAKIDSLMALFDAAGPMLNEPDANISVYTAERGLAVFG
jgi:phage terminase large subunit-like protein